MLGSLAFKSTCAACLGIVAHLGWFIHGEHDLLSRYYATIWAGSQLAAFLVLRYMAAHSLFDALTAVLVISSSFVVALFSSIVVYRLVFHPLRKFPGPLSWRLTKLAQAVANADFHGYLHLDNLHRKYGDYVRIGPNGISTIDPAATQAVLGSDSKCIKPVWYDSGKPLISMHTTRDRKQHETRRKALEKGFSYKALRDYDSRVVDYANRLMDGFRRHNGVKLNASKWYNYYSFDIMGDLAFGESFHMLETGEKHFAIPLLQEGMAAMNMIPIAPWLFYMIAAVPMLTRAYHRFIFWSEEQIERRKKMKVAEPDLVQHIMEAPPMSKDPFVQKQWEVGDARMIIVAGSDTTAATLSYCTYELIRHPKILAKLREEVRPHIKKSSVDHQALQYCHHLNAVIDETLRLYPPLPSGLIRKTPPEGLKIGERFIPGNTDITLPFYSLHRSSEAFERPNDFLPERWNEKPELVKDKRTFVPFSLGPMSCAGKALSYMQMRTVLGKFVTEFDFEFAHGEDGSTLLEKTEDHFTLNLADLWIVCKERQA